jgi:hypothetical protein
MRIAAIAMAAALLIGCGDDSSGNGSGQDFSANVPDLSTGAPADLTGGTPDLAGTVTTDAGVVGSPCMTACDCTPGLACGPNNTCVAAPQPIYCCGSATCPSGSVCQGPNGMYSRCGNANADLGGFDYCPLINCSGANGTMRCVRLGCASCGTGTGGAMVCAK